MTSVCSAPDLSFPTVLAKFESFHRDPLNVALHVLTTPLVFLGYMSLGAKAIGDWVLAGVALAYFLSLPFCLNGDGAVLHVTVGIFAVLVVSARRLARRSWTSVVATTLVGALGQAAAHHVTGERAYMETYVAECRQGVVVRVTSLFFEQAFFQIPLVLSVSSPGWWPVMLAVPLIAMAVPARTARGHKEE